jgi:PAS domain S-box-containing protein
MCHDRWQALGTCTDVTDRRLVQQASQEMGRRHRMIIGQIPDAVYLADAETGRLIESNPAFQRLLGYSAEEVLRLTLFDFVMAPREDIADRIARASETGVCPCGERLYRCRDGRLIEVEPNMSSLEQNGRKILCVVARDITERKAAEAQILAYQQQLCAAAAELSLAEERERRRIALSLHDGMGQLLAVARMKLDSLTNYADKTRIDEVLPEVQKLLAESIRMTRSLTSELSPPILYEQGLEPALEWLAKAVEKEHHLEVSFVNDDKPKTVPEDIRILLFRATRELLFNVVKHAKAHSACIAINRSEKNELCLSVLDDGIGYEVDGDPTLNGRAHGYGLFSIHDRLRRIGGQITIDSTPGNGTCVSLEVPLNTETRSNR